MPPALLQATWAVVATALFFVGVAAGGGNASHILALAGTLAACGALGQLYVARQRHEKQTEFDLKRHEEQTKSDFQRHITENFTKAVEQLASDKLVARLGGIYALERISKESPADYRTVIETLTAFVREQASWENRIRSPAEQLPQDSLMQLKHQPKTDVAAVLAVLVRRSDESRRAEQQEKWRLDLSGSDLRGATLRGAHLERADLSEAHLEQAYLTDAHLERADLREAHLEQAYLTGAHLEGADLTGAHLERTHLAKAHLKGAILWGAHLEGARLFRAHLENADLGDAHLEKANLRSAQLKRADLTDAHLEGANLKNAQLEGADLTGARLEGADLGTASGLTQAQVAAARGDQETVLPKGLVHPPHWPTGDGADTE